MDKRVEGYWYSKFEPKYPMPVANTIDMSIKDSFIAKLKSIEKIAREDHYMGVSSCRICNIRDNGSGEYEYKGWVWPEGYMHYIRNHNVAPSKEFYEFVMKV